MNSKEIINRKITNIYQKLTHNLYGLDYAECFIELDYQIIVSFPWSFDDDISVNERKKNSISIFEKFEDQQYLNKQQILKNISKSISTFINQFSNNFASSNINKDIKQNKLMDIKNRMILDVICYQDTLDKAFLLLDNGNLITEISPAPNGTARAGLHIFDNQEKLFSQMGNNFIKLSETSKDFH